MSNEQLAVLLDGLVLTLALGINAARESSDFAILDELKARLNAQIAMLSGAE